MAPALRRERPETCLSDLVLERFLLGEIPTAEVGPIEQHLGGCAACRDRSTELAAAPAQVPDMIWWRRTLRQRRARGPLSAVLAGVAAIAAAIVIVPRLKGPPANDTRVKGAGFVFEVVARRPNGQVQPVSGGMALRPGDAIRFVVTAPEPGHVAVLGLDAAGHVSIYAPAADAPLAVAAGTHELPGSIVLDETAGDERLVAVFCATAPTRDALIAAGARALAAAGGDPRRAAPLDLGLPCRQDGLTIHKDAPP
jgi:hypothetical protein